MQAALASAPTSARGRRATPAERQATRDHRDGILDDIGAAKMCRASGLVHADPGRGEALGGDFSRATPTGVADGGTPQPARASAASRSLAPGRSPAILRAMMTRNRVLHLRSLAIFACCLALQAALPSVGAASPGRVELVGGGFVEGDVIVSIPGERVVVRLPDGTQETLPWDRVSEVRPIAPTPAAAAAAPPDPETLRRRQALDAELRQRYLALPRRGGTIALLVLGSLGVVGGLTWTASAISTCHHRNGSLVCDRPAGLFLGPIFTIANIGFVAWGGHRAAVRRSGLRQLRAEGLPLDLSVRPGLELGVGLGSGSLRLRF